MTAGRSRSSPAGWLRDLRRAAGWHRRLLVAGLLAASVAFGIQAVSPPMPRTASVVVAAHDLAGGTRLSADDVRIERLSPRTLPDGALRSRGVAAGRTLVAPVRAGEVITDLRLLGRTFLDSYGRAMVAAPVRIADAASTRLVRPGDVVDVLASGAGGDGTAVSAARLVAATVPVITVPAVSSSGLGETDVSQGALIVVVTTSADAARLAAAAVADRLSLVIHGR